ncbi:MAG TPA: hypothetical protein VK738_04300 [Terriglobales bacterium]|jgi:hypothetical protein|nr:hypothetical protein [Terriglobales bacterium]
MLSNRWNQVKDPEAKESLRLIEQAINQLGNAIGIDPFPSQQNLVAKAGNPIFAPQPPSAFSVTQVSGGVLVSITSNSANIKPVNYFVESSATADFASATVYPLGILQAATINIGTATLYWRCRCQAFTSQFSGYLPFGAPTAVTGGSSALGSTTGSGAVVLQTGPTIVTPTISGNETVTGDLLLNGKIKNQAGTTIMGVTQKTGSGTGNYSTTLAAFTDIDGTNLSFTTVVPVGWKALITFSCSCSLSATTNANFAITDAGAGLMTQGLTGTTIQIISFHILFTGDGASHTFKMQYNVAGGNTLTVFNSAATLAPVLTVLLMPSN